MLSGFRAHLNFSENQPRSKLAQLADTVLQVLDREPDRPRSLSPDVPRDLETICRKCLEKEPARRYPSARALADDLGRYLAGELIHARSFTLADRLARTLNRDQEIRRFRAFRWIALGMATVPFLSHLLPFLRDLRILRQWTGICDVSADFSPIMSATPAENLYVTTGWGTWGFKAIPAGGSLMAEMIATGETPELLRPFGLDRFARDHAMADQGSTGTR